MTMDVTKEWLDTVWRESAALFRSVLTAGVDAALEYTRCLQALRRYAEAHRAGLDNRSAYRRYDRGDIVWVDFGWPVGNEYRGIHPGIVLNWGDTIGTSVITVVPLTSRAAQPEYGEIALGRVAPGTKTSTALTRHITTISKLRILKKMGHLPGTKLSLIEGEILRRLVSQSRHPARSEVAATTALDKAGKG